MSVYQNHILPLVVHFCCSLKPTMNLNRPIPALIERAGFKMRDMETMCIPGWKPASFNYWGTADAQ